MKTNLSGPEVWQWIRKYLFNKYIVTLVVFLLVMIFIGDQSLLNRVRRARQIHQLEDRLEEYRSGIEQAEHDMQVLQNTDSLERFAREQYYMHAPNEDVFVIENE